MRPLVWIVLSLLGASAVSAQEPFIYPTKGQNARQQDKDKYECYGWAKGQSGFDPMAPEHVAPLVTYLASPASRLITGEVFVVHGGVAALMGPPTVRQVFRTTDGGWTLSSIEDALGGYFTEDPPRAGFVCEETIPLAESTFDDPTRS